MKRLLWLDIAKALAISWVVYFHFFNTCFEHTQFPPDDWSSLAASTITVLRMVWLKISGIGFDAVGVFIILSAHPLRIDGAPCRIGFTEMGKLVPRALPASLSNVLGRASGLSRFAVRRAARAGR